MANCNCNNFPISCAPHAPGGDCHHHHGCPPHPCPPPDYKGGTSMYIGARYVPIFADPVEWDNEREYEPLTIVVYNGDMYTSKCYVPKGAALPEYPENQTKYWVRTADYNYQFADLKKTVNDLSRLVEQFQKDNQTFTDLINGWNEKVQQWETEMMAWGERLDTVESHVADLTANLNAEIARAKAAEQANAAAIAQETTDRNQAISELDAAYKAADAAEAQAREAADTALGERIDSEAALRETGDNAVKALIEQEQTRAEGEEEAIRHEFAAADTALSNRITANKTDIDALKAEQTVQNTNISNNAKNISDNAAEIAKHAARLTSLESNASDWDDAFPDTTIAQEMQKEELARANADTALNGRIDAQASDIEELRDAVNHKVDQTIYTADQTAQNTKIKTNADAIAAMDTAYKAADAELNASITAETDRATNRENEIETGYKKAINDLKTEVTGDFVTKTVYDAEQAAQDTKITAAQNAADTANTNIGDWETDHPGQTISQCATSLENETAANAAKADANAAIIGDWNTEHPGTTIAQKVTRLNDAIPDVSGFVTETTYNDGQAEQDTKITAAQNAADKANATIGDWDAQHPGKTIAQIDVRTYLDELYPESSFIRGERLADIYPMYESMPIETLVIPIIVPYIVTAFFDCWNQTLNAPASVNMYTATGVVQTRKVTRCEINCSGYESFFYVHVESPFDISQPGIYYFKLIPDGSFVSYHWTKNNIKFTQRQIFGD